jgi:hypothetical protein
MHGSMGKFVKQILAYSLKLTAYSLWFRGLGFNKKTIKRVFVKQR